MSPLIQFIYYVCAITQFSFAILLLVHRPKKKERLVAWRLLVIMTLGLALYPIATWIHLLQIGPVSSIFERLIYTSGVMLCSTSVHFFYLIGWGRSPKNIWRLHGLSFILFPLTFFPGFVIQDNSNVSVFGVAASNICASVYYSLIFYSTFVVASHWLKKPHPSAIYKALVGTFFFFAILMLSFDAIPYILFRNETFAYIGPLSSLAFSVALYWACLKQNFFSLRESLNHFSMIMLGILVATSFAMPLNHLPYIRATIILLCAGMIIDLWFKDRGLKTNFHRLKIETRELRVTQANTSGFLMDIAHRLKSPLGVIENLLTGIRARRATDQPKLDHAAAVASTTRATMKNLVTAGQIDHGTAAIQRRPLDLRQTLDEWADYARALLPRHRFDLQLPPGAVFVNGDASALKDALTNLLDNARKFSPDGSPITLALKMDDDQAILSVEDRGRGISPNDLKRVFERHWQEDTPGTGRDGSAGLGLALVRWVAIQHGGSAVAASVPGQGAHFTIKLPLLESAAPESIDTPDEPDDPSWTNRRTQRREPDNIQA